MPLRQFRRRPPPVGVHPLVRMLFAEMERQQIGVCDMSERTGIDRKAIGKWRKHHSPDLANLDACFTVLGLRLAAVPPDSRKLERLRARSVES